MISQNFKSFERFADAATLVLIAALGLAMLIGLLTCQRRRGADGDAEAGPRRRRRPGL